MSWKAWGSVNYKIKKVQLTINLRCLSVIQIVGAQLRESGKSLRITALSSRTRLTQRVEILDLINNKTLKNTRTIKRLAISLISLRSLRDLFNQVAGKMLPHFLKHIKEMKKNRVSKRNNQHQKEGRIHKRSNRIMLLSIIKYNKPPQKRNLLLINQIRRHCQIKLIMRISVLIKLSFIRAVLLEIFK